MNEPQVLSRVQFLDSTLLELSFITNPEQNKFEKSNAGYSLGTQFALDLDKSDMLSCKCMFDIAFSLAADDNPDESFLDIKCKYESKVGILKEAIPKGTKQAQLEEDLKRNAFSYGYGYMVSLIDALVKQGRFNKLLLPIIDVDEYLSFIQ